MKHLLLAGSLAALPVLGFAAAFHPSIRRLSFPSRVAAALALGYVELTLTAVLLSMVGIPWSVPILSLPPLLVSALLWRAWRMRTGLDQVREPFRPSRVVLLFSAGACALAALHLFWSLITGAATSIDFLLFWGVKAARFAQARGIDASLLKWKYFVHAVPHYPPAVPILDAWGALWAGGLSWRAVPVFSALWMFAAWPLLLDLLRRKMSDDEAAAVSSFWFCALCISLAFTASGGSAEAPLVFCETIAVAALLAEDRGGASSRFLPGLMLMGAVLTKVEGSAAAILIAAGALLRDLLTNATRGSSEISGIAGRTLRLLIPPAAAVSTWFAFQAIHGFSGGYGTHGAFLQVRASLLPGVLRHMLGNLGAGNLGLSWIVPGLLLLGARPSLRALLPALALTFGLFVLLAFDYMHDPLDPTALIRWTTPRVTQPALSAWILAAGVATASIASTRRAPDKNGSSHSS